MPTRTVAPKKKNPKTLVPAIVPEKGKRQELRSRAEGQLGTNIGGTLDLFIERPSSYTIRGTALDHKHGRDRIFSVRIIVKNTGKETLRNISLAASGPMVWKPKEARIAELKPGQSKVLSLSYSSKERIKPIAGEFLENKWQSNFPVAAKLKFTKGSKAYSREVPVDYLHYTGWSMEREEYGDHNKTVCHAVLQMAYEEQPGLLPHVAQARKKAEEYFGGPLDQSPAARLAAAKAVSALLQDLGARYISDASLDASESVGHQRSFERNIQYPTETLYYGGDCEDLSILYGFFMYRLGIPFAVLTSTSHVQPLVEIYRGKEEDFEVPAGFEDKVITLREKGEARVYIAVDPSFMQSEEKYLKEKNSNWFENLLSDAKETRSSKGQNPLPTRISLNPASVVSSVDHPPGKTPPLGESWFGKLQFIPKQKKKK